MNPERWQRIKEVFGDALDIDEDRRDGFLAAACGADAELRREVDALLDGDRRQAGHVIDAGAPVEMLAAALNPTSVGPYRILDVLGEGGMGKVYLAEQSEPVERRVALKLIKLGMDTGQVLERFDVERQALAMMEHDSIAKVFDAGTSDSGQSYIVMEYVPGTAITTWCDQHRLDTRQRLELFREVCAGVQHAHQKGVIHRDLKPSNILVTEQGGRAVPKIIDFGVAKAAGQDDSGRTLLTEHGQMIGTPEYMAPEQAEVTSANVDTRSDVYALGVILYELLAGGLPFACADLRRGSWLELQQQIYQREPTRPSARLDDPARARELRGELDWIVVKALQRERDDRYGTPLELARDLERYLAHEPVDAGPPSTIYRLRKFVRRNRLQVGAASALFVTLLAGGAGSAFYMLQAEARLDDFNLLASVVKLADAEAAYDGPTLYPAWPDKAADMRAWITEQAEPLERDLPNLQGAIDGMRARALAPTEEDRADWSRAHPRAGELDRLRRQIAALERAAAVRAGELTLAEHRFRDPVPDDARGLNAMAWPLVSPDESEREWGREVEGLTLAKRAFERGQQSVEFDQRARTASTLAWALFACGYDEAALAMAETAVNTAEPARKLHFASQLRELQESAAAAGDGRGSELLSTVRAEFDALEGELAQSRSYRFAEPSDQFLHDSLAGLVERLREFADPEDGKLSRVRERLKWAETVHERTVVGPAAAWDEVRRAVAASDGFDLPPQLGLVPIGTNPVTGLQEFYHPRSALDPDRIPRHDEQGSVEITGDTGIVFALIPGGTFLMGAQRDDSNQPNHDPGAMPHETPIGMVIEPFFLARHELTQGQWLRLSNGKTPSSHGVGWDRPDDAARPVTLAHPVELVSWGGCRTLLSRHGLELPAEAQWEYACRAGKTTPWFTGREPESLEGYANIRDGTASKAVTQWGRPESFDDGYVAHAPVGTFLPNPFGLYDMHGNVWECCRGADPATGSHVVRGGSFMGGASDVRSAMRMACETSSRHSSIGVRAARRIIR